MHICHKIHGLSMTKSTFKDFTALEKLKIIDFQVLCLSRKPLPSARAHAYWRV